MTRHRTSLAVLVSTVGLLLAAGCSGDGSPTEPKPPPEPPEATETCTDTEATEAEGQWQVQATGVDGSISNIHFVDERTGRAVQRNRNRRKLLHLRTTNGGDTWCAKEIVSTDDDMGAFLGFVDADVGFTGGEACTIYRTDDGGDSWNGVSVCGSFRWLLEIGIVDARTIWFGGGGGLLFRHLRDDASWTRREVDGLDQPVEGISFPSSEVGLIVVNTPGSDDDNLYRTTDGGESWSALDFRASVRPKHVTFLDTEIGVVVGEEGMILRSLDAGLSWEEVESGTTVDLFEVDFGPDGFGVIVGGGGTILVSEDAGATWTAEESGVGTTLSGVSVLGPNRAWVSGSGGLILTRVGE